jgi:hypothetical protein
MSNWEGELNEKQILYAASDALSGLISHLEMQARISVLPAHLNSVEVGKRLAKEIALSKKDNADLKRKRANSVVAKK